MAQSEKRSAGRFNTAPGSYVVYAENSGAIRDLSLSGVFVLDSDPLPPGTKINFELQLRDCTIPLAGVISRAVPGEGMAIRFLRISPEAKAVLKMYIDSLEKSSAERKP